MGDGREMTDEERGSRGDDDMLCGIYQTHLIQQKNAFCCRAARREEVNRHLFLAYL